MYRKRNNINGYIFVFFFNNMVLIHLLLGLDYVVQFSVQAPVTELFL